MPVAYFVRGGGERWAVVRLTGGNREEVVADGLSQDAAVELCFKRLEELSAGRAASGSNDELPLDGDIAPRRRRPKQLSLEL